MNISNIVTEQRTPRFINSYRLGNPLKWMIKFGPESEKEKAKFFLELSGTNITGDTPKELLEEKEEYIESILRGDFESPQFPRSAMSSKNTTPQPKSYAEMVASQSGESTETAPAPVEPEPVVEVKKAPKVVVNELTDTI